MTLTRYPKPVKPQTRKRQRRAVKNANIAIVREIVFAREVFECRIGRLLAAFGFIAGLRRPLDLAHIKARGIGGNPDLSRDTPENTIACSNVLHTGARSLHSGHVKVRPLTDKGANGPLCFEFYEKLPIEL